MDQAAEARGTCWPALTVSLSWEKSEKHRNQDAPHNTAPSYPTAETMSTQTHTNLFDKISSDISDRSGLGDVWNEIDEEVMQDIRETWENFFQSHTKELETQRDALLEALQDLLPIAIELIDNDCESNGDESKYPSGNISEILKVQFAIALATGKEGA